MFCVSGSFVTLTLVDFLTMTLKARISEALIGNDRNPVNYMELYDTEQTNTRPFVQVQLLEFVFLVATKRTIHNSKKLCSEEIKLTEYIPHTPNIHGYLLTKFSKRYRPISKKMSKKIGDSGFWSYSTVMMSG